MDFFAHQDKARRNTGLLVFLFILAVLLLIGITNLAVMLTMAGTGGIEGSEQGGAIAVLASTGFAGFAAQFDWSLFMGVSALVGMVILLAIAYKWVQLADGGKSVAESLGGNRIHPNTDNAEERRILNVVEEMALASGMPVPPVYLLENEVGINAFAAGHTPADAVIGVTRGCIQQLNRDQLQGVIAHEFSHILNGDMRLNLRLIAVLHGIVFLGSVGELLVRSRGGGSRQGGQAMLLGVVLLIVGWLGNFFGNLIRSAVSRQREFLADASAVQFTRNPQGIVDALRTIGGHQIGTDLSNPRTGEVSHLFFGQAIHRMFGLFDTHPPVDDRILRLNPHWDGTYLFDRNNLKNEPEHILREKRERREKQALANAVALGAALNGEQLDPAELLMQADVSGIQRGLDHIPQNLQQQAREPLGAMALVLGLLLSPDSAVREKQRGYLNQLQMPGLLDTLSATREALKELPRALHLPLVELSIPALKCISPEQYELFRRKLLLLMHADQQIDLYEWCLFQLLTHYLDPEFGKVKSSKPRYKVAQEISDQYQLVLSLLVHEGHNDPEDAQGAFNRGIGSAGLYNLTLLPAERCQLSDFKKAVNDLACCYPHLKPKLINGFINCVKQDGRITIIEKEMVHSIAAAMDSPIPQLEIEVD